MNKYICNFLASGKFHVYEQIYLQLSCLLTLPVLQGEMAVQDVRGGRAPVQGAGARVPGLVRGLCHAVAQRERRRVPGVPPRCLRQG